LARQPRSFTKVGLGCEYGGLILADRSRITGQDLHSARRAPCIAAASVKDVDPGILDRKNQPFTLFCLKGDSSGGGFRLNVYHERKSPPSEKIEKLFILTLA
jgi:hypothetical protein